MIIKGTNFLQDDKGELIPPPFKEMRFFMNELPSHFFIRPKSIFITILLISIKIKV